MDEADDHESRAVEGETYLEGKLRAVRVIGEGGMGRVVEVVHTLTEHHRALKTLRGPLAHDPRAVKRFLREASAAGRIGNPHIVEIFDAGYLASGEPYLLMELLDGATLLDWIDASAPSWVALLDVFVQACDALEAAHAAGVVHRDLKPEN
ncbi:MAG: serine/threonine protein kinase, partial [Myxococcales bacterium]|nr:serine/threonine protein kinase [Myxococcales bacterium]